MSKEAEPQNRRFKDINDVPLGELPISGERLVRRLLESYYIWNLIELRSGARFADRNDPKVIQVRERIGVYREVLSELNQMNAAEMVYRLCIKDYYSSLDSKK